MRATESRAWRAGAVGVLLGVVAILLALSTARLEAQYFGRNKVQYEKFDFKILETPHYDIYFYPAESLVTADAARMAERWYGRLSRILRHNYAKKPIIFYADHPDFEQTNITGGLIDQSTGGFTEGLRDRVVMPFTGVYADNDHVIGHELVHSFQYDMDRAAMSSGGGGGNGINNLPLWLIEGMAEYLSLGRKDAHTAMWMRDAALRNDLPSIKQLTTDPRYFPYRYGQALWAYIGGKWGDRAVTDVYRSSLGQGFDGALRRVLGRSADSLSKEWLASIRFDYMPRMQGRTLPKDAGEYVLKQKEAGDMNLSPTLSPDGRFVAFLGRKDVFTIDLYVADATTGKIVKRLTSPNTDNHIDALSFIQSSGAWSPDARKLAFVVFANGDNELAIFDVPSRKIERRVKASQIGAISDPTWSPDGRTIAFSGSVGGQGDLFTVDIASGRITQLTNDRFADLQPTWSPDGSTLAFATDRGEATSLELLTQGPMRLALFNVASNEVRLLPAFADAKHINPQFSPSGEDLFFVSDRGGFTDIYRMTLASGQVYQVTNLATGVSGITYLSPALTVARGTGRMMFSVFDNSGYSVFALSPDRTQGVPVQPLAPEIANAGVLVPIDALADSDVERYLADAATGLPTPGTRFAVKPYRGGLSLDYLGAPGVGVGVSSFGGAGFAGGVAAYFGDLLGNKTLAAAANINGTVKDFGGQLFYLNSARRWNYLLGAAHSPYLSAFGRIADTTVSTGGGTRDATMVQQFLQRAFFDQASATVQYPFSQTRRFELGASYNIVNYDIEVQELFYLDDGSVAQRKRNERAPPGVKYAQGTAALVGDYSFFGFTSPVAGGRYRFEVSPVFGGLTFNSVLGDYRRYFFMRPVTLAFRGFHYGRYGKDSRSDSQLSPLFVGQETLIRGYAAESFDPNECTPVNGSAGGCPEFDRLIGSRLGVVNAELRIPLFGTSQFGIFNLPFLPTEITPFFDAGLAWSQDDEVSVRFDRKTAERVPVFSTGVSARMNLLGFAVLEAYYAYPFQREVKGWHFGFVLSPGW